MMRRDDCADHAGQLRFDVVDELGIGLQPLVRASAGRARVRSRRTRRRRQSLPDEARQQVVQVGRRRRAAPEARAAGLARLLEDVDEQARLARARPRSGGPSSDTADVGADVGDHAPDHGMRDLVQARQPEQLRAA